MRGRWLDLFLAALFAFLAVGCGSLAATALLGGQGHPEFVSPAIATAAVLAAFAAWTASDLT